MTQRQILTATLLGWLLVLMVAEAALTTVGDPVRSVAAYVAVWLVSTTLPGVLLWRAWAQPTTVVQEIGFGSVLGIAALLLAWLPATLAHRPTLMWLWPAGLVVVFASVPSLRRHWRPSRTPRDHTPGRWHIAMMAVFAVAFLRLYVLALRLWPLPPTSQSGVWHDAWYELSLTQALGRTVAIQDPSVAGVRLHYHWFSNAHAAATMQLSGVSAPEVILHLWLVAMLLTLLFAVAAATERILQGSGDAAASPVHWWAGPLAALLGGALSTAMILGEPRVPAIDNGFVFSSTSGVLALVVILAFVGPVLDLVNGLGGRKTWLVLLFLFAMGAGTKPSILPVVASGGLVVLVVQWAQTRKFPIVPLVLTVLPLALIPVAALAVTGSTGGSRLQLFQTLALDRAFDQAVGGTPALPGRGGWLAPGLATGSGHVWAVGLGLFVLFLLTELPRLIGLAGVTDADLRRDPGTWWCTGVVGSGFVGSWVLAHPGYSQHYFWRIVIPLSLVLTVTMIVRLLPEPSRRAVPAVVAISLVGLVTGAVLVVSGQNPASYAVPGRLLPYAVAVAVLAGVMVALRWVSARMGWMRVPAVALVASFVCAAGVASATHDLEAGTRDLESSPVVDTASPRYISGDEQRAALWLNEHSGVDDVVATNVFCTPTVYRDGCRHLTFWVQGLSGRQLFIGGWAFTEKNLTAYGLGGDVPYPNLSSPWPDRVALSLGAVRSPSAAVISQLERRGVGWIFADRRATMVSPNLGRFATLRYSNADVMIYRLGQ